MIPLLLGADFQYNDSCVLGVSLLSNQTTPYYVQLINKISDFVGIFLKYVVVGRAVALNAFLEFFFSFRWRVNAILKPRLS